MTIFLITMVIDLSTHKNIAENALLKLQQILKDFQLSKSDVIQLSMGD